MDVVAREPEARKTPTDNRRRAHVAPPDRVDVAIVGSGLGGLVAGALLAKAGLSVAVFEAHYTAGGCATQFSRGPKRARYHFDVGLHYVGDCGEGGAIPTMLRDAGVSGVRFRPMDPDGFDRLVFPDHELRIPADVGLYRDRLVDMFPRERRAIDRYVRLVRAVMRATRQMERRGRPRLTEVVPLAIAGLRLAPHRSSTMQAVFESIGMRDPRLRALVLGQSGDYGLPPSRVSALLHMGLAGHYFRGAYYPEGGGQVIADGLAARIEALSGTVHLRTPVERILVEGGRAVGLRLEAKAGDAPRDVRADLVISNADYKRTLLDLVGREHLPAGVAARTERAEMAAAIFMTFLGVRGELAGMGAHNIWQFDSYDMEAFYRDDLARPITPQGCYVTSATHKDPANARHHAPSGVTSVEVMTLVPSALSRFGATRGSALDWSYTESSAYVETKRRVEEDMIARLDRLFPGAAERVVFRESATPVTHVRYTRAEDGTGYGLACTPEQFMAGRPGYRGPIEGLYLAGASTRSGHGIVGAMASGRAAASVVLRDRARATVFVRP